MFSKSEQCNCGVYSGSLRSTLRLSIMDSRAAAGGQDGSDESNELQATGREQGLPVVLTVD